jgi:hypothetical protein
MIAMKDADMRSSARRDRGIALEVEQVAQRSLTIKMVELQPNAYATRMPAFSPDCHRISFGENFTVAGNLHGAHASAEDRSCRQHRRETASCRRGSTRSSARGPAPFFGDEVPHLRQIQPLLDPIDAFHARDTTILRLVALRREG